MKLTLLGLILVMLVSGCTGTGNTQGSSVGGSVAIKSFSATSDTNIQGNDKIGLTAEFANVGDSKATAVQLQLLPLDLACSTAPCVSTDLKWGLQKGAQLASVNDIKIATSGQQPVSKTYSWTVQAPQLPVNIVNNYNVRTRLSFAYSTVATKQITVVTSQEYDRLKAAGQTLPVSTTIPSNGPIGLDVGVTQPITIDPDSTTADFTLTITGKNLADGNAFLGNDPNTADDSSKNSVKLKLTLPSDMTMIDTSSDCTALQSGTEQIQLAKRPGDTQQKFTISCDVRAPKPAVSVDKTVKIQADYGYFVDSQPLTISVTGKRSYAIGSTINPPGGVTTSTVPGVGGTQDTEPPNTVRNIQFQKFPGQPGTSSAGKWQVVISFLEPSDDVGVAGFEAFIGTIQPTTGNWNTPALDANNEIKKQNLQSYLPLGSRTTQGGAVKTFPPSGAGPLLLDPNTAYYIAVEAIDVAGFRSDLLSGTSVIQIQTGSF